MQERRRRNTDKSTNCARRDAKGFNPDGQNVSDDENNPDKADKRDHAQ
jgi:hypothetical protein